MRGAAIAAALVVSHWVLDFASHRADMPLWPGGGPLVGLGLWRSAAAVAASALGLWLIPLWGAWIERRREARTILVRGSSSST